MARTIEPGVNLLTASEVRVAVLPVGPVPREALDDYFELISRYHHVSLTATRSFYRGDVGGAGAGGAGANTTPFQFMDWNSSYMKLRFLQAEDARARSRIPDLHAQRQVLAIIGVVHCPLSPSVARAYEEFKRICRAYPEALVHRCFVFEPSEDHIKQDSQQLKDMVMFPPGGPTHLEQHLEVWMYDLVATVLTEFEKWMLSASPGMVRLTSYADSPEFSGASGVLDEVQKRLTLGDGEVRERQRRGRLLKLKGDMCLMCGSPRDAYEHYRSCQDIAKGCGDWVWYGAAVEGMAAARVLDTIMMGAAQLQQAAAASGASPAPAPAPWVLGSSGGGSGGIEAARDGGGGGAGSGVIHRTRSLGRRDGPGRSGAAPAAGAGAGGVAVGSGAPSSSSSCWELLRRGDVEAQVRELLADARAAYKRKGGVPPMMVEQHLKLARLAAGLRGYAARREACEAVAAVQELLPSLGLLEDRLVAVVECAQVLGLVGSCRKRTLLLWHALELARAAQADKGELLRITTRALEPSDDPQAQDCDSGPPAKAHWSVRRAAALLAAMGSNAPLAVSPAPMAGGVAVPTSRYSSWDGVQMLLLEAALAASKQAHAPVEAWEAAAALLREHHAALPPQHQALLLETLSQASAALQPRARTRPGQGPGPVLQLRRLLPASPPLQPARVNLSAGGGVLPAPSGGGGRAGRGAAASGQGPFIFNPYAAKRQAHEQLIEGAHAPEWTVNDEGRLEVYLINPLAVPLKIDLLQLNVRYCGTNGATPAPTGAASTGTSARTSSSGTAGAAAAGAALTRGSLTTVASAKAAPGSVSVAAAAGGAGAGGGAGGGAAGGKAPFKTPALNLLLPPNGRPQRVVLCGKPMLAGYYVIEGCLVTMWGVTWQVPFSTPLRKLALRAATHSPALCAPPPLVSVHVLPALPLLRASIRSGPPPGKQAPQAGGGVATAAAAGGANPARGGGSVVVQSPRDEDIHAPSGASGFGDDLHRGAPVAVHEGQVLSWSLELTNIGGLPVSAASVTVTNQKGQPLKPLRGSHLPASFQGVHLEVDDALLGQQTPLEAGSTGGSLPLRPGASVVLPMTLHVGSAPRGTFREVSLEVRVAYLQRDITAATASPSQDAAAGSSGGGGGSGLMVGRRVALQLQFDIHPTLHVASTCFQDHYLPLLNGQRLPSEPPLDVRASLGGSPTGLGQYGSGFEGGGPMGQRQMVPEHVGGSLTYGAPARMAPSSSAAAPATPLLRARLAGQQVSFTSGVIGPAASGGGWGDSGSSLLQQVQLSSRLAGLDLSVGAAQRAGSLQPASMSRLQQAASFGRQSLLLLSSSASMALPAASGSTGAGPRTAASDASMQLDLSELESPSMDALGATPLAAHCVSLDPCAPSSSLGLVTDCVLSVSLRNTSANHYFRAWLARIGEGAQAAAAAAAGPAAGEAGGAAGSSPSAAPADVPQGPFAQLGAVPAQCTSMEVLQPGDTVRLVCVVPSAALAQLRGCTLQEQGAAAEAAHQQRSGGGGGGGSSGGGATESDSSGLANSGGGAGTSTSPTRSASDHSGPLPSTSTSAPIPVPSAAMLKSTSLRVRGPRALVFGLGSAFAAGSGGGSTLPTVPGSPTMSGRSGGGSGALSTMTGVDGTQPPAPDEADDALVEEADRMACAEAVAEGWAVVWEMVTGLSDAAAGRQPPRGLMRLAAVDIARSLTACAVNVLQPSVLHFSFRALAPPAPAGTPLGAVFGPPPRLKDLKPRLPQLGLVPPLGAGALWGLVMQLGESVRLELQLHNTGTHTHHVIFSLAAVSAQQLLLRDREQQQGSAAGAAAQPQQAPAASTGPAAAAAARKPSALQPLLIPPAQGHHSMSLGVLADPSHHSYGYGREYSAALLAGVGVGVDAGAAVHNGERLSQGGGYYGHAAAAGEASGAGAVLVGAVQGVHLVVEARSVVRHPLALTFVSPGLYQVYVYDVCVMPEGADASLFSGRPGQAPQPQRVYASMDRLLAMAT